MITKPMLAAKIEDASALRFPLIATPKLDGIRCLMVNGKALTRSFKPIPNAFVRTTLERDLISGYDGELMLESRRATFQDISSAIMSKDGEPRFTYHIFDMVTESLTERYVDRLAMLERTFKRSTLKWAKVVPAVTVHNEAELRLVENGALASGFEGLCLRTPDSPYKCGRSTVKEGWLLKLKRFVDAETFVIGFEEQEQNLNEKTRDELGRSKRSSHKAGKVGKGTLGAFICADHPNLGPTFKVGTGIGLTAELRQQIWDNRDAYLGKVIKYRYQAQGTKDAPRIPSFQGFRDARDL